ncbi:AAA family ATPase [Flaviaesturariibacter terrae]
MIITRLSIKNWKNFKEVEIPLQERVFIVGPNASGKSNLLDIFRFLRDIAKPGGGLQKAVTDRGGITKIRCLAARKNPDVELQLDIRDNTSNPEIFWKYALGIKQESRGYRQPYLTYERVWKNGELILDRPNKDDKTDKERLTQTHLEQINSNLEFRDLNRFFESMLYLHLIPQLLKYPNAFTGQEISGDPFGKGFLERISKVNEKTRKAWLKRIEAGLQIAVPQLKELNYSEELGKPHLEAIYDHWRPKAGKQREDQFSDGTLRLIGLLWSLQEGDSLLLLEEPELSLNSGIVSKLPSVIYRFQKPKNRQVIMTTHSADLLKDRSISPTEIVLLEPSTEGTKATIVSTIKDVKSLLDEGMDIGEAILPRTKPKNLNQLSLSF